mmetsp:Transcript_129793/g.228641  ORF Transcript_129793/g.228641 Transcript_129793/m.228641 type:complete len:101 (-) Transcript_129793:107-409(-)
MWWKAASVSVCCLEAALDESLVHSILVARRANMLVVQLQAAWAVTAMVRFVQDGPLLAREFLNGLDIAQKASLTPSMLQQNELLPGNQHSAWKGQKAALT